MSSVQAAPHLSPLPRRHRRCATAVPGRRLHVTRRRNPQSFTLRLPSSAHGQPGRLQPVASTGNGAAAGSRRATAPAVRSFECDLCRLRMVGPVGLEQALTAAAMDGGAVADEHIASGVDDMVVETVYPGSPDGRSTISTRLFLPARKVKQRAKTVKNCLNADLMAHGKPDAILAMTFRQVVLDSIWSFELAVFAAGNYRNMDELALSRQVLPIFSLSSSDGKVLSMLAEVFCSCVMRNTLESASAVGAKASSKVFPWFKKAETYFSKDYSVSLYKIHEDEMIRDAKALSKAKETSLQVSKRKMEDLWFIPPSQSLFEPIGSPELQIWAFENVPAYRIEIDGDKYEGLKFEGWQKTTDNKWEIRLTYFQMADLANILDIYYVDRCTNPDEVLPDMQVELPKLSASKKSSFWQIFFVTLASGSVLLAINVIAQLCQPTIFKQKALSIPSSSVEVTEMDRANEEPLEATEVESSCRMVIEKIKEALSWTGDVTYKPDVGAWVGELPSCVDGVHRTVPASGRISGQTSESDGHVLINDESNYVTQESTSHDIAIYQVILSGEGNVVGFMPMNRMGVNYWASNPLAKLLYKAKKLSPGIVEPALKIQRPDKVIQLELLMSMNEASQFALVRCDKHI